MRPLPLLVLSSFLAATLHAEPLISEFMASNVTGLEDEDGQRNDWIEIHNPDSTPVNLAGWHLTDRASSPDRWTFPAVVIPPKGFLLVWASDKNRAVAGSPLHTNFRLDAGGEYLALTRPDNSTAHAFAPVYPPQAPDTAYGVPVVRQETVLTGPGVAARFRVPTDGSEGTAWRAAGYDDSTWQSVTTGVGYDAPVPPAPATGAWADSAAEFSGVQGQQGWHYGYWNRTTDADQTYAASEVILFPRDGTNVVSAQNAWNGTAWDLSATGAPWTEIGAGGGHPNGTNSGSEHWTVRRWVSEFTGRARFVGTLSDGAECGDGVELRILVEGVPVFSRATFSAAPLEFSAEAEVMTGQRVDFVIAPRADDGCDGHAFNVRVLSGSVADSVADWSSAGQGSARGWTYGYYRRSGDLDGIYQTGDFTAFPRAGGNAVSPTNAWNGTNWQLSTTTPVTALTATGGTPATTTAQDWPVRRWTSPLNGRVLITGAVGHSNAGSNGVICRIQQNGTSIFQRTINGVTEGYAVLAEVTAGSVLDFMIDPNGAETADTNAVFTAVITPATTGAAVAADSLADWGTGAQGGGGWRHGFYNRTDDPDGSYAAGDFRDSDPAWTLAGGTWALGPGDPPWTLLGARTGHPNGTNQSAPNNREHWAVRRWISTVSGEVTVAWHLAKAAAGGGGTTVRVFHNGVERAVGSVSGTDRAGIARCTTLTNVAAGDTIDVALTPEGPGGNDDGSDSSHFSARVLYNALPPNVTLSRVADSAADWSATGTQGERGWSYGYYDRTADGDGTYQAGDFTAFLRDGTNTVSAANHWNGSFWDLNPAASGPWTELGPVTAHPNGTNSAPGAEQWCIRRWTSTVSGPLSVTWRVWKTNPAGSGVSGRCFLNGTPVDAASIAGADTSGVTRTFFIPSAAVGDRIDVALTPVGPSGATDDGADGSAFSAVISRVLPFDSAINAAGNVRSAMQGINASAYLRVPFTSGATAWDELKLRIQYDDGFAAWLNGAEVTRRGVPVAAVGGTYAGSVAEFSGVQGQNNWFYGYWNKSADADGSYGAADFATTGGGWGFLGSAWGMSPGNPPWTTITAGGGHPNGSNSGQMHNTVRRWVAESSGTLTVRIRLFKENTACGTGVTGLLHHNGRLVWSRAIAGSDGAGVTAEVPVSDVQIGDVLDLMLDAANGGDTTDPCDGTHLSMTVEQQPSVGLTWNSAATAARPAAAAGSVEEIDLTTQRFAITPGANVLALHGLNAGPADADFLLSPTLVGVTMTADAAGRVYFLQPTPGQVNGSGSTDIGPVVANVTDAPAVDDAADIVVTARVTPTLEAVGTVTLHYRVMYGPEASLTMKDDGLSGDGAAADGVFGAAIPATASTAGQMVRWRVTASDASGDLTRSPSYTDPLNSPEYWGTVVAVPNPVPGGQLPVLHWFTNNAAAHDGAGGGRCSIFYNGQFLDNVSADIHGQSSQAFPKKSYDFHLNTGFKLEWDATPLNSTPRINSFNLLTTYPDKAYLRNVLAYEVFRTAGVPAHWAHAVQVRRNNAFYSVAHMVEDGDEDYLQRAATLDDRGALYKMYNSFESPAGGEKKSREWEGSTDLSQFMTGLTQTGAARERFLYDNAGIPETINYLAAHIMTGNDDCCHKNYYVYRDSEGNREWRPLPWDVDLSFGRVWRSDQTYYRDAMEPATSLFVGLGNRFMTPFLDNSHPVLRQMYLRRLRTLADSILNQSSVPVGSRFLEGRLNALQPLIQPEADYERSLGLWGTWGTPQTMAQAIDVIRNDYLGPRRTYVFSQSVLPPSQSPTATVQFGTVEFSPASGNQAEEYFTLVNSNPVAVDVSGWEVTGAVRHVLKPGTVIPAGGTLHLSPDVNAFRGRTTGPSGNQGLFVQGDYNGQLSARGETLTLMDGPRTVATLTYNGAPSAAQEWLRITELMYAPAPRPGDTWAAGEYEFIELTNVGGAVTVPLSGVRFGEGVAFTFTGGALAPGGRAVLVRNAAAFAARYPGVPVAGTFTGSLNNAGERLVLLDDRGEEILDFSYDPLWYPSTDGGGFSLTAADGLQAPDLWNQKIGWRASGAVTGTPGGPDEVRDTDGDGMSDGDEWLAGTDPWARQSVMTLTGVGIGAGGVWHGSFTAVAGRSYTVQVSDDLTSLSWQKLMDHQALNDGVVTFSDPGAAAATRRFYRVVTPATP